MGEPKLVEVIINEHRFNGQLYRALMREEEEKVINLCQKAPDKALHILTPYGDTVLHIASSSSQESLLRRLLEECLPGDFHKKISRRNHLGNTILHEVAISEQKVLMADIILAKAPELLAMRNDLGETALFRAAACGRSLIFDYFHYKIPYGDQDSRQNFLERYDKSSVLHISIINQRFDLALQIAKWNQHLINEKDKNGMTALQLLSCNPSAFKRRKDGFPKRHINASIIKPLINSDFVKLLINTIKLSWDRVDQTAYHKEKQRYDSAALELAKFLIKEDNELANFETTPSEFGSSSDSMGQGGWEVKTRFCVMPFRLCDSPGSMGQGKGEGESKRPIECGTTSDCMGQWKGSESGTTSDCMGQGGGEGKLLLKPTNDVIDETKPNEIGSTSYSMGQGGGEGKLLLKPTDDVIDETKPNEIGTTSYSMGQGGGEGKLLLKPTDDVIDETKPSEIGTTSDCMGQGEGEGEGESKPSECPTYDSMGQVEWEGKTPLFLATKSGCVEIVQEILKLYPLEVEYIDEKGQNILHLAIKYRQLKIFKLLKKMKLPMIRLVRQVDNEGNSILHMAGKKKKHYVTGNMLTDPANELGEELGWFERVKKVTPPHFINHQNRMKQTADELFARTNSELCDLAKEWLKRASEGCSFVAVLIATVAFAAAYTIPGGPNQITGRPLLLYQPFFVVFIVTDVLSVTLALKAVLSFLSILTSPFHIEDFKQHLPRKFNLGVTCLFQSVAMMILAFAATISLMIHNKERWIKIVLFTIVFLPIGMVARSHYYIYYNALLITSKYVHKKVKKARCAFQNWSDRVRNPTNDGERLASCLI